MTLLTDDLLARVQLESHGACENYTHAIVPIFGRCTNCNKPRWMHTMRDLAAQLQTAQHGIEKQVKEEVELAIAAERSEIAFDIENNPNSTWTACTRLGIEIVNARLKDALKRAERAEAQLQTAQEQAERAKFKAQEQGKVKLLKPDDLRAWRRISDNTIHIGEYTLESGHAERIARDILELITPSDLQARHQKDAV